MKASGIRKTEASRDALGRQSARQKKMAPRGHRGAIQHLEVSSDQNLTVMPEYSEFSVHDPGANVVQAKLAL
jgi:hypothetical protein